MNTVELVYKCKRCNQVFILIKQTTSNDLDKELKQVMLSPVFHSCEGIQWGKSVRGIAELLGGTLE